MAKYNVRCYYTYCAMVEVEANSIEEAADMAYEIAENMPTDELEFAGANDYCDVQDESGETHQVY